MARTRGTKTRLTKTQAQKYLSNAPEDKVFWSHDGKIFRNLFELQSGLSSMDDETYAYHTRMGKNDFSTWIREIIGDETLASDMEKGMARLEASMEVESRIHSLISQ